jgi:hypothetical protein
MTTDLFSHFSWGEFILAATVYTLAPFLSGARYGNPKRTLQLIANIKSSPKATIEIHAGFLALLLGILWESAQNYSSLPRWLTEHKSKGSVFDLVLVVVVILMVTAEQRWILNLKPSSVSSPGG